MKPLQIMIGYDPNEAIAYHVLAHSIMRRASRPVAITPLYRSTLQYLGLYDRPRGPTESTQFSLTRFLTPYLSGFDRVSIFMDCDMLVLGDVCELADIALADPYQDVFVVKHDYTPATQTKFLGQPQTAYPRKNWSSVMVFNGHRAAVRDLVPQYINKADPADLHRFAWAGNIGDLPPEWNHLVGEYPPREDAKLVHYTLGGPYFSDYRGCEYTEQWFAEAADALHATGGEHLLQALRNPAMISGNIPGGNHDKEASAEARSETGSHADEADAA